MGITPEMAISVRKAKPRDAEVINSFDGYFEHLSSLQGPRGPFYTNHVAGMIASQSTSKHVVAVAEIKGRVIGYAWSQPFVDAGPVVHFDLLAVDPGFRRRGVAQELIDYSVRAFRQFGYKLAVANVATESLKAFVKAGWQAVPDGQEIRWSWPDAAETMFGPDPLNSHYRRVVYLRLTPDAPAVSLHSASNLMGMLHG